ncbi:capsule polysaccharide biosynthesis domain protein [Leptospira fainei serovar Hurstbridge str. BUT 6]|uniref:Capsule polysaccharide biosynthesis domain protein n=1 Tax=Leptospira fainei serovar Hurstbridge str. BUT 6 TaxID=1193011 RepID=S3VI12_9LEPT|nr:capsule polysaccharide biosynthesis domain protein [Leptospira fainei]EPG76095.1 capsule polysaccharide biosynthesis domain protein [Leptospira fainei serovar Hurstbridge str. BUT 6]
MNLIIYGLYNSHHLPMIEDLNRAFKIEYCEIIGNAESNSIKSNSVNECRFHDWHSISLGYSDVDWNVIAPLDQPLIELMRDCEVEVYRMMDRKSLNVATSWSYNIRKKIYYEHLRYWNHILNERKFDCFLSLNIPHEIIDFIIYWLCKKKGIATFFFYQFQYDITFLMSDWTDPLPNYKRDYEALSVELKKKDKYSIELSERILSELAIQRNSKEDYVPFYMRKRKSNFGLRCFSKIKEIVSVLARIAAEVAKILASPNIDTIYSIINRYRIKYRVEKYKNDSLKSLRELEYTPRSDDRYIYVPLHLQPELSTSPMAGRFVDQRLILEMLSYHIPDNILLYVKEHPNQDLSQREYGFYRDIAKIKTVRIISREFSSRNLLSNCVAVATASGTVGWEAIFMHKPVLLFGHTFFQYAPGVFKISSSEDCRKAIERLFSTNSEFASEKDLLSFLKVIDDSIVRGNIDIEYRKESKVSYENDIAALSTSLSRKIRNHLQEGSTRRESY